MMDVLARRTIETSGKDVLVEIVATGNGPAMRTEGCPMIPLSMAETHRLLSRFGRSGVEGEGLTPPGERLLAVLGEVT